MRITKNGRVGENVVSKSCFDFISRRRQHNRENISFMLITITSIEMKNIFLHEMKLKNL